MPCRLLWTHWEFLSTPSARRATAVNRHFAVPLFVISIHALREEGDTPGSLVYAGDDNISIHALREEGDHADLHNRRRERSISIHALREEGDSPKAASRGS